VGTSWVTKIKERGERLDETAFVVDVEEEDIFQKVSPGWWSTHGRERVLMTSDENPWSQEH